MNILTVLYVLKTKCWATLQPIEKATESLRVKATFAKTVRQDIYAPKTRNLKKPLPSIYGRITLKR